MSIMMQLCEISIHALLAESDFEAGRAGMQAALFLSTLSLRRATSTSAKRWMPTEFLSTLSLRRATHSDIIRATVFCYFYPRSPCGERLQSYQHAQPHWDFYPRSPCGERPYQDLHRPPHPLFLSTLSLRRATSSQPTTVICQCDFYPRSPCGERRIAGPVPRSGRIISIHALLAESDMVFNAVSSSLVIFLSTLSLRRATGPGIGQCPPHHDFYPRSPCGERRCAGRPRSGWKDISIHALLAESDAVTTLGGSTVRDFYPRSPCGERLRQFWRVLLVGNFYPRSPCGERPWLSSL